MKTRSIIFWVALAIVGIIAWVLVSGKQIVSESPVTPKIETYQPIPITPCAPDCGKN